MACCKRKGDPRKCIPFYVVAGVLIFVGVPLMIVGIVAQFNGADVVGYVGGICIFFGFGFFLLWHMLTIENVDKGAAALDYDPNVKDIRDVVAKSYQRQSSSLSLSKKRTDFGVPNIAFDDGEENRYAMVEQSSCKENENNLKPLDVSRLGESYEMNENANSNEKIDTSSETIASEQSMINIDIPSQTPSLQSSTSYDKTTATAIIDENVNKSSMMSLPVEIA